MRKRGQGNIRRFLIMIHCKQGQRSGKIHMIFQGQLRGRFTAVLSQVEADCTVVPWPQEHTLALSLPPSCFPVLPPILTTWHQAARSSSICLYSQAEGPLKDRWMDGWRGWKKKKGDGKVNSQVSNECCWVSFISFRLRASLSTTRQHTW